MMALDAGCDGMPILAVLCVGGLICRTTFLPRVVEERRDVGALTGREDFFLLKARGQY